MKRLILFSALALFAAGASAQERKIPPVSKSTSPAKTPPERVQPRTASAKDSALCKTWKLVAVEEFSVKGNPAEDQKNDAATFMTNKTASVILNGKQMTGTWELDKSKTNIIFTEEGSVAKTHFKLVKVDAKEMVYEWQDPKTQIRTLYYFEPLKK